MGYRTCKCGKKVADSFNFCPYCKQNKLLGEKGVYSETIQTTHTRTNRIATSVIFGIFFIVGGLIASIIPIIGWIACLILVLMGIVSIFSLGETTPNYTLQGICPHCESEIYISDKQTGINCKTCKKRLYVQNKRIYVVT